VIAHDFFRMSLREATRRLRRSETFRHPHYAMAELFDPVQPDTPFVRHGPLYQIERDWYFSREAGVPDYIKLFVGRVGRLRWLAKLEEEYALDPHERFQRIDGSIKCAQFEANDPATWGSTPYFCAVRPDELRHAPVPIFWAGNRSVALTHPMVRKWFFDPRSEVLHGTEAHTFARQAWRKIQEES
jgi:hypothetical protein